MNNPSYLGLLKASRIIYWSMFRILEGTNNLPLYPVLLSLVGESVRKKLMNRQFFQLQCNNLIQRFSLNKDVEWFMGASYQVVAFLY